MSEIEQQLSNSSTEDCPFEFFGRFGPDDADLLLNLFKAHHIRCSADVKYAATSVGHGSGRAVIEIYVHPKFLPEASQLKKTTGVHPC